MRMECFSSWKCWYRTTHQGLVFLQGDWQLARRLEQLQCLLGEIWE